MIFREHFTVLFISSYSLEMNDCCFECAAFLLNISDYWMKIFFVLFKKLTYFYYKIPLILSSIHPISRFPDSFNQAITKAFSFPW